MSIRQEEVVPIYEYKCRVCLKRFSVVKSVADRSKPELCIDCTCKAELQFSVPEIIIR